MAAARADFRRYGLSAIGHRAVGEFNEPLNLGTPKGLRQLAQGCEAGQSGSDRATLGTNATDFFSLPRSFRPLKSGRGLGRGVRLLVLLNSMAVLPWGEGERRCRFGNSADSVALAVIGSLASFSMGNRKTFVESVVRGNPAVKYFFTMASFRFATASSAQFFCGEKCQK